MSTCVNDGTRTHDNYCHKVALYQLSYVHHIEVSLGLEPKLRSPWLRVLIHYTIRPKCTPSGIRTPTI